MTFDEYQRLTEKSDRSPGKEWYYGLGLTGEAGEVVELIKKSYRLGQWSRPYTSEELALELGDVLWYVARLAATHGISLEEIAKMNLDKLDRRITQAENVSQR